MLTMEGYANKTGRSAIFNFSFNQVSMVLEEYMQRNRIFERNTEIIIIVCYAFLMVSGIFSNLLVTVAIFRNKIRTNRNLLVVNLNFTDITLCIFCMPFTALVLVKRHWPLDESLCKIVPFLQGSTVFVSAATVSAIAIDRYNVVTSRVPQKREDREKRIAYFIFVIWIISIILSSPVCFSQTVSTVGLPGIAIYKRCVEHWPSNFTKSTYTIIIVVAQFIIPATVLVITHFRIKSHLNITLFQQTFAGFRKDYEKIRKELGRNKRATMVLMNITVVFAASWLPWNVVNLVADFHPTSMSAYNLYLSFAVCHIIAMTSATSNPILYGWLNTNIRRELLRFGHSVGTVLSSLKSTNSDNLHTNTYNIKSPFSIEELKTNQIPCIESVI
ncbi:neuropeptide Y receptor type 6-like [Centruroides vittatus]|uniref:neuropeptide Y receptor type 6-like n=1 Tax=Centruroides vittatus TaxID=120091 RepID=UPI003510B74E